MCSSDLKYKVESAFHSLCRSSQSAYIASMFLRPILRLFETWIDPFRPRANLQPPGSTLGFIRFYIGQAKMPFVAMFGAIIVLFFLPWLDTSKVRSAVYRPWYKLFFWLFVINAIILGWLGSQPAEGLFTTISQICTLLYFAFFLVAMPVLGLVETPRRIPNSITEAVLEKRNKTAAASAAANA